MASASATRASRLFARSPPGLLMRKSLPSLSSSYSRASPVRKIPKMNPINQGGMNVMNPRGMIQKLTDLTGIYSLDEDSADIPCTLRQQQEIQKEAVTDFVTNKKWVDIDLILWWLEYIRDFVKDSGVEHEFDNLLDKIKAKYVPINTETLEQIILGKTFHEMSFSEKVEFLKTHTFVINAVRDPIKFVKDKINEKRQEFEKIVKKEIMKTPARNSFPSFPSFPSSQSSSQSSSVSNLNTSNIMLFRPKRSAKKPKRSAKKPKRSVKKPNKTKMIKR